MAGKRQHFIPQFLQRGFASHVVRDEAFTWVYRKGDEPFNANIKNVGVEGFFYSEGGDRQLDDSITTSERDFSSITADLCSGKPPEASDAKRLAQLVAHLEVRTRHIRQSFLESGTHLLDELLKFVGDNTQAFGSHFQRKIRQDPSLMRDAMSEELRKRGIPQTLLPQVMELSAPLLERAMPGLLSQLPVMAEYLRATMPSKLKGAVKAGHIKGLNRTLAPEVKVRHYSNLSYRLVHSAEASLPLGDSAVLFHVEGERAFKPFFEKDDILRAVLLPVSPHNVLVGSTGNYQPDFLVLPQEIVRCSLEYFIASETSEANARLSEDIGVNAHLLSESQIKTMVSELIDE